MFCFAASMNDDDAIIDFGRTLPAASLVRPIFYDSGVGSIEFSYQIEKLKEGRGPLIVRIEEPPRDKRWTTW
jgi:hypothetical protein